MKVMLITKKTQNPKNGDFCFANDGEIARLDSCGERAFIGIDSQKGSTTVKVMSLKLTKEAFAQILLKALTKGGWPFTITDAREMAEELSDVASKFKVNDVVSIELREDGYCFVNR
jgi:predicted metalloprotease